MSDIGLLFWVKKLNLEKCCLFLANSFFHRSFSPKLYRIFISRFLYILIHTFVKIIWKTLIPIFLWKNILQLFLEPKEQ